MRMRCISFGFSNRLTTRSFRDIWITNLPLCALGLCSCVLVRKYTLKRNVVEAGTSNQDIESKIKPPTGSEASSTV